MKINLQKAGPEIGCCRTTARSVCRISEATSSTGRGYFRRDNFGATCHHLRHQTVQKNSWVQRSNMKKYINIVLFNFLHKKISVKAKIAA